LKIDARGIERFLADPGACRAVLLHGDDTGLVHERADQLTRRVAGNLDDAFRVAILERETHDRLLEEATALSLIGGRRVVRVRDASDGLSSAVERALAASTDALIVMEAASLPARSKLRALLEARREAAVIACYPEEGGQLASSLRAMIERERCRIDADALAYLASQLGADRAATRGEVEKLVLYAGEEGRIDLEAVEACVADASALSLEDALYAATAGDVAAADRALERAIGDGAAAVQIARALLYHVQRLRGARLAVDQGMSPGDAAKSVRPPVFYKRTGAFGRALSLWSVASLERAASETNRVELACKQTGAPDLALCRNLVATVARQAAAVGRR
jgi:DNA polymerase-3 subunit delta